MASPQVRRRTFVIGFDFGTHSTKIVLRERENAGGRIVAIQAQSNGYIPLVAPSLVRIIDNRLYFGGHAAGSRDGKLFRSLKVRLIGTALAPDERDPESELLIACYMAWCFQQLLRQAPELLDSNFILNISAPTTDLGEKRLVDRYLRVCHAAWAITFGSRPLLVEQGLDIAVAEDQIRPILDSPVPSRGDRNFFVLAETIAPIVSLRADPFMPGGMYMIADIGASTTEVSVFHVDESNPTEQVLCYCDRTDFIGGNDVEALDDAVVGVAERRLVELQDRLRRHINRVWAIGFQKDAQRRAARQRWMQLKIVSSGGGSLAMPYASVLGSINPIVNYGHQEVDTSSDVSRHVPAQLEPERDLSDEEMSLFAVANGLAHERRYWPFVYHEHDIEELSPNEEVQAPRVDLPYYLQTE